MRFLDGIKAMTAAIAGMIWPKVRARQSVPPPSTSEAERLDRLRNPSKYLGK
jgi:hypothetical protein